MKSPRSKKLILIGISGISFVFLFTFLYLKYVSYRPNIVLITIDALRPDHLSCYGYERKPSPNIDKIAKEGTMFLRCYSPGPSTVDAIPGFLTGKYLLVFDQYNPIQKITFLNDSFTTIAEYLEKAGYYTAAFVFNPFCRKYSGFDQGFFTYISFEMDMEEMDAEVLTSKVIEFLNDYNKRPPFFLWIHYIDPHLPYLPPKSFSQLFENDSIWNKDQRKLNVCEGGNLDPYGGEGCIPQIGYSKNKTTLNYYVACYDAEILYTDYWLGKLLEEIKKMRNTLIIITADHGESLGEHNMYFTHGENIYDEGLHVPLIIKDNKYFKGGRIIFTPVSSVDIVPTILSIINPLWYFLNRDKFDGIDLRKVMKGKSRRKYIYSYFRSAWSIRDVERNIKYILYHNGKEELYILPDENINLINDSSLSSLRDGLRKRLKTWLKIYPIRCDVDSENMPLDEKTKEILKSLGYF